MRRTLPPITAAQFTRAAGRAPIDDELQRANCTHAGHSGHMECGWCAEHDQPAWACKPCAMFAARARRGVAYG
jgi:hypothetical protein